MPEKQVQAKLDLSKQIAETAKKCLGVNIQGKDVFESIILRPAPLPPALFVFSSALVEKKAPLLKASTVSNKAAPQLVTNNCFFDLLDLLNLKNFHTALITAPIACGEHQ